jgi:hypothetical protein
LKFTPKISLIYIKIPKNSKANYIKSSLAISTIDRPDPVLAAQREPERQKPQSAKNLIMTQPLLCVKGA